MIAVYICNSTANTSTSCSAALKKSIQATWSTTAACLAIAVFWPSAATAVPNYSIATVGLYGSEHTSASLYFQSDFADANLDGQIIGSSQRFNGGIPSLGYSAWFYDGTTTIDISLTSSEYTRTSGYRLSEALGLNELGQVIGQSFRYDGTDFDGGQVAWLYDGMTHIDIGMTGVEHTRDDGVRISTPQQLNEAGHVIGSSRRYSGASNQGLSAWLYDGSTTINIGIGNSDTFGYKYSESIEMNEAGQVIGNSEEYYLPNTTTSIAWLFDGATTLPMGLSHSDYTGEGETGSTVSQLNESGQVLGATTFSKFTSLVERRVWLYDGAEPIPIGLIDPEHTRSTSGYRSSTGLFLNEAGQGVGYSERANGPTVPSNRSAWLYDGTETVKIGFADAEHTRDDSYRTTNIRKLNEAGQAAGISERYNGGNISLGFSSWLYDGTQTVTVGLVGSEYTRTDDYKRTSIFRLNEAGQATGYSERFDGSTSKGYRAWRYDDETTTEIGLTGSKFIRDDGFAFQAGVHLNEAGQIGGGAFRYNGGSDDLGQSAWLYDPVLDDTVEFEFSTRSDGYAFSEINYLGEDGLVLGTYTAFAESDASIGSRAFFFTLEDGANDLGAVVDGGLTANGWESLAEAIREAGAGQILGYGNLWQRVGQSIFLLKPATANNEGDFDGDGDVDGADFLKWQRGETLALGSAEELALWEQQYGSTVPAVAAAISTPEPSTLLLASLVGLLFCSRRRLT